MHRWLFGWGGELAVAIHERHSCVWKELWLFGLTCCSIAWCRVDQLIICLFQGRLWKDELIGIGLLDGAPWWVGTCPTDLPTHTHTHTYTWWCKRWLWARGGLYTYTFEHKAAYLLFDADNAQPHNYDLIIHTSSAVVVVVCGFAVSPVRSTPQHSIYTLWVFCERNMRFECISGRDNWQRRGIILFNLLPLIPAPSQTSPKVG